MCIRDRVNDARRWLNVGIGQFQPSELAKVTGILYLSSLLAREPEVLNGSTWEFTKQCMAPIFLICGITAIEPSLSAAMAIGFGMVAVLYFAGVRFKRFAPYAAVGVAGVVVLMIIEPWRLERFNVFLGRGSVDYQITQSLLAIGTGGIFGQGLGLSLIHILRARSITPWPERLKRTRPLKMKKARQKAITALSSLRINAAITPTVILPPMF